MRISNDVRVVSTQGAIIKDRRYYNVDHVSLDGNMVWRYYGEFRYEVSKKDEVLRRAVCW